MAAQVLLQVEDGQRVALVQGQQLAQRGIRLDRLLVHQVVGAGIGHHTLGHRGAAHLRVLGLAQEGAQLGRDLHRLGEDAGLGLGTLNGLHLALAAAIRLLDHTRRLLLDHLQGRRRRAEGGLETRQLLVEISDGLLEGGTDVLLSGSHRRLRGGGGNHGRGHRGRHCNSLRLLGSLGGLGWRSSHNRGGDSNNSLSRLGGLLGSLGNGRTHFGVVGGSN